MSLNHAQLARTDFNLLLLFDLLWVERHSGRAAARLNLSPSAVSHALRRLRRLFDDPLFLASPEGMKPTPRAEALAPEIAGLVARIGSLITADRPFDPATAVRRFRIGAPDGSSTMLVPALIDRLGGSAPAIDVAFLQLLPAAGSSDPEHFWRDAMLDLAGGRLDCAILPYRPPGDRFASRLLYGEEFVVVARPDHPYAAAPDLELFTASRHLLTSASGDPSGLVDLLLGERGLSRRVMLTVPNFLMAANVVARTDLLGTMPRRFARTIAGPLGLAVLPLPLSAPVGELHAICLRPALGDHGLAWLLDQLVEVARAM